MKIKYIKAISIISFILFFTNCFAQDWEVFYGESDNSEYGQDVVETYDKGYLFVTYTDDVTTIQAIKTDINGEILWQKNYNSNDKFMYIQKVIETSDNGYVMVGYSVFYNNYGDPIIIKFNSCFEKEWCKIIHKPFRDGIANDVLENNDNELIVLTNGNNDNPENWTNLYGITLEGELLWEKDYAKVEDHPLIYEPILYDLMQIGDGYYASGFCYYPYPDNPGTKYLRPFIVGIDENFDEKWILPYGISDSIVGIVKRMNYKYEDTIYGFGYQAYYENNETLFRGILIKFNAEGEELGYFALDNDSISPMNFNGNILNLKFLDDGLLLGSDRISEDGENIIYSEILFDTLGNVYDYKPHDNYEFIKRMITTYNDKYLQCASYRHQNGDYDALLYKFDENLEPDSVYSASFTYDSLCPYTIESEDLELNGCTTTGIGELPTPKEYYAYIATIPIKAYPNPVSEGSITFEFENTGHHNNIQLRCFDIYGKQMHKEKVFRFQGKSTVDVGAWQKGMYVAVVYSNGWPVGECKFVVQE